MTKFKSVSLRFLKGFIAAGLAQVALTINAGLTISSMAELNNVLGVLAAAFLTGGVLALEKMMNWTDAPMR
jgi:hypothetical protein